MLVNQNDKNNGLYTHFSHGAIFIQNIKEIFTTFFSKRLEKIYKNSYNIDTLIYSKEKTNDFTKLS